MKKGLLCALLGCTLMVSGCSTLNSSHFSGPLNVNVDANLTADVVVGEKIAGTASGTNLLWLFDIGMPSKFADGVSFDSNEKGFSAFTLGSLSAMKAAAAYDAVTKSGADVIVAPRYVVDFNNYLLFKTVNVTVTGYKGTIRKIN